MNNLVETDSMNVVIRDQSLRNYYNAFPSEKYIRSLLPHSFVINQPLNEVGGDGYWIYENSGHVFFVLFDCMGHGRFASIMTRKYIDLLQNIVVNEQVDDPGAILNRIHDAIQEAFHGKENLKLETGADMAILKFDLQATRKTLFYAGAKINLTHDLYGEIEREKGVRMQVGEHFDCDREYVSKKIELPLNRKTNLYLYTDGVTDMPGGEYNKKMGFKNLKPLLIQSTQGQFQKKFLLREFEKWAGSNEAVDDLLFAGISV